MNKALLCPLLCFLLTTVGMTPAQAQTREQAKVSLQFRNMNIHDVFKTLSKAGDLKIVTSKPVQGSVSIFVDSLAVLDALELVVEMQGLAYYREHGIIRVVTADEYLKRFGKAFKDRMQTRIVKLRYVNPEQIVKLVFQLKSKDGNVIADQRSNSVVIVDLPGVIDRMVSVMEQLDVELQTRTFGLTHTSVQAVEEVVKSMVSAGGKIKADAAGNQLTVIDDRERIERIEQFLIEADKPNSAVMQIFSLQYTAPEDIAAKIQDELTPGIGSAVADNASKKLFVQDLPANLPYIEELIASLDQRTQQVLIEAKIIQVNLTDEYKMGVDWGGMTEKFGGTIDISSSFRALAATDGGLRVEGTELEADSFTLNGLIEALQTVGKTDLLSNPRITCLSGKEAFITVGSTVPYKTIDTREDQGGALRTFEKVVTVEVGVKLRVTPSINDEGYITMKIKPEVSEVTSFIDNIPVIEKSESETTVIVKDGVTIIIGGLIKDQKIETEKRIPLLGSIPVLGIPFRSKSTKKVKSELVILLQPKIITGDVNMGRKTGS